MIATEFQDQVTGIFMNFGATGYLYLVLDFPTPLDAGALALATRRLLDAEPVLGCRFDDSEETPVWRRRADLDTNSGFALIETGDIEGETTKFVATVFDPRTGDNMAVRLLRRTGDGAIGDGAGGDRLILCVSHTVADGGAAVMVLERLATLYSGIVADPAFQLPPNPAPRDSFGWLANFSLRDKMKVVRRDLGELPRLMRRQQGFLRSRAQFAATPRVRPILARMVVPAERLATIDAAAKAHGLSRNDMLLGGFARAFVAFCHGDPGRPLQIIMPVNLRRYAETESRPAICNLGGISNIFIEPNLGKAFGDTVQRVDRDMERQRKSFMGAANPYTAKMLASLSYARKRRTLDRMMEAGMKKPVPPTFTNVGRIQERRIRFAGTAPTGVTLYGTPLPLPIVVVAVVEYAGSLILTMPYYQDDYPPGAVEHFLADIVNSIETNRDE
ncbi:hypothetical protein [Azospirillum sp. B4]|uniref:hypothetical protein n=1 Tax=Azospirillum sp. B4 TaxID=95605 RepID=UPI0011DDCA76|nr:hypothetical protein [Azospirillum sp. B4]